MFRTVVLRNSGSKRTMKKINAGTIMAHLQRSIRLFVWALLGLACCAHAQPERLELVNAGFAFAGNYADRSSLYPISAKLLNDKLNGRPLIEAALQDRLESLNSAQFRLNSGLVNTNEKKPIQLAFALTRENVEAQAFDGKLNVIYSLSAQVLVFDYESMTLIAAYPVRVAYSDVRKTEPTEEEKAAVFRHLYLDKDLQLNVFDEWVKKLQAATIRQRYPKYLQITSVEFSPEALETVPNDENLRKALRDETALAFEENISQYTNVPMVPHSEGEAIGAKMPLRFANGSAFTLKLPNPDYTISILVRQFKKKTVEDDNFTHKLYGSYVTIKVEQPDLGKNIFEAKIRELKTIKLAKMFSIQVNDWQQYRKSLLELLDRFASNIRSPDDAWLKEATKGPGADDKAGDTKKAFSSLLALLKQVQ